VKQAHGNTRVREQDWRTWSASVPSVLPASYKAPHTRQTQSVLRDVIWGGPLQAPQISDREVKKNNAIPEGASMARRFALNRAWSGRRQVIGGSAAPREADTETSEPETIPGVADERDPSRQPLRTPPRS
jgi:hypothetical protein